MLSNIFSQAVVLLKEKKFNVDYDVVIEFLNRYKSNEWIYPAVMKRALKIDLKLVYEILELCVEQGLVEQYLEVYCPRCQRFTGCHFKNVMDIPDEIFCIHCDEEFSNPLSHAIVIYKVL